MFLEQFDFKLLEQLIRRRIAPFEIKSPRAMIPAEKFYPARDPILGEFNHKNRTIGINPELIKKEINSKEVDILKGFIETIIHEQVHAITTPARRKRTGFRLNKDNTHDQWNEGVTEKFSREIALEYMSATGISGKEILIASYPGSVAFVDNFIKRISEYSGVSEQSVWNAILRAFFTHGTITDEDLKDVFPEGFYQSFKNASDKSFSRGADYFIRKINAKDSRQTGLGLSHKASKTK